MDLRNRRNVLRELIDDGKPTISTHVHSIWPGIAEVIGHAGTMDYIEFTGQYAPWDLLTLENFGRAIDLFPNMSSMMKLDQEPRTFQAERAVGSGIQNLLFADVRTVQDAEECVAAVRAEHPDTGGIAGAKSTRDMGYVYPNVTLQDYVEETKKSVVAIMIEKKMAVENLEAILDVPGIDMVQFGPGDYSMSIGQAEDYQHPEVAAAEKYTIEECLKRGIRPRAEIGSWELAKPYLDMGIIDFCVSNDVGIIFDFMRDQGERLAKLIGR